MYRVSSSSQRSGPQVGDLPAIPSKNLSTGHWQRIPAARRENVLAEVGKWMGRELRCVAGRREYTRGNYLVRVASRMTVPAILEEFKDRLRHRSALACLFVFTDPLYRAKNCDAATAFRYLAGQMSGITEKSAEALAGGAALTISIELTCPVTGQPTIFDDFECIAFCPQSNDKSDPLYDPLMFAPYPSVNLSSDVYGFSCFVAESADSVLGHRVVDECDLGRLSEFFDRCVDRWHRIASKTIDNFAAATDVSRCPVHRTEDGRHWIAAHRDPAFAERSKIAHTHELPVIYAKRIAQRWLDHFSGQQRYDASGLAQAGTPI
jgi:hypothetical protein